MIKMRKFKNRRIFLLRLLRPRRKIFVTLEREDDKIISYGMSIIVVVFVDSGIDVFRIKLQLFFSYSTSWFWYIIRMSMSISTII